MQYSVWDNQIANLARYAFSFIITFIIWPRILFKETARQGLDAFWSRYTKMTCLVIGVVYVLVIIKLYELISFIAVLVAIAVYKHYFKGSDTSSFRENTARAVLWVYDFLDRKKHLSPLMVQLVKKLAVTLKDIIFHRVNGFVPAANTLGMGVVLAYSLYLRYYDAVINAAPAMSDAYVTMAWAKYAEQNILFHDGIYPYGFYNYLSLLHKFAFDNALYVLKYTGPLDGMLTAVGLYFIVTRFTGRIVPGIVAAFIYGVMVDSLHLYLFISVVTGNSMMATRFTILWGLVMPMGVGLGWSAFSQLIPGNRIKRVFETIICLALIGIILVYLKPTPVIPYKMQRNSAVEQYLRITKEFRPTEWMIVSPVEGYALSLGIGYHLMLGDFLNWYNPADKRLAHIVNGQKEYLLTPDTFIFKEKKLFVVDMSIMEPILKQRVEEYKRLDEWVKKYRTTHDNISIYYEDDDLQVFRIHQPKSREKVFKEIWGEPSE